MDLVQFNTGPATSLSNAGDGQSDQSTQQLVAGRIVAVYVEPDLACLSASVHLKIMTRDTGEVILEKDIDAAGWFYPRTIVHLNTTGGAIANTYSQGVPVYDYINAEITNGTDGDNYEIQLLVE